VGIWALITDLKVGVGKKTQNKHGRSRKNRVGKTGGKRSPKKRNETEGQSRGGCGVTNKTGKSINVVRAGGAPAVTRNGGGDAVGQVWKGNEKKSRIEEKKN